MIVHLASFLAALVGFLALSLAMDRHKRILEVWLRSPSPTEPARGALRIAGWCAVMASIGILLAHDLQLGAIYWCAYASVAASAIVALHTASES